VSNLSDLCTGADSSSPEPEILQMTATTGQEFGDLVDQRRAEYGHQKRQRKHAVTVAGG
jgi:hypothetical protein